MNRKQLSFKEIAFNSPEYVSTLLLRDKVLRKPLGMSIYNDPINKEFKDRHFVLKDENEIIGCLIITPTGQKNTVRMRQVCIETEFQKQGLGKKLITKTEEKLRNEGITKIILHARSHVIDFYAELSYHREGAPFFEIGMAHQIMFKYL